jgi:Rrf2 family protein
MEISRRTDYGVRVILDLASLPEKGRASTQEIASRQNIPNPFLAKIVSQLSLAGLVTTYRGAGGGVTLARPPAEISLLEVIEALEGPVRLNRCLIEPDACPQNDRCPVHSVWAKAQRELTLLLGVTNFDELAETTRMQSPYRGLNQQAKGSS